MFIDFRQRGGGGPSINVEALTITKNGKYEAPEGTAYTPVDVNVAGGLTADWASIGYAENEGEKVNDAMQVKLEADLAYSKTIQDKFNANPSFTGYNKNPELVYMPRIDLYNGTNSMTISEFCNGDTNLVYVPDMDFRIGKYFQNTFRNCKNLVHIGNLTFNKMNISDYHMVFTGCLNLTYLGGFTDFGYCQLDLSYCPKITRESCLNVFNTVSADAPNTIYLHPEVKAKLSPEDIAIATNKGWKLA